MWRLRGRYSLALVGAALAAMLATMAAADAPVRVAVFDFELIDTSLEGSIRGEQAAETERLDRLGAQLREAIGARPGYTVVDIAPVAAEARAHNLQRCGECDRTFAEDLGADWSITGTVQKVSNLILNINVYVRDVATGKLVQSMSADIRGNTDISWERGLSWLIRNRLELPE